MRKTEEKFTVAFVEVILAVASVELYSDWEAKTMCGLLRSLLDERQAEKCFWLIPRPPVW